MTTPDVEGLGLIKATQVPFPPPPPGSRPPKPPRPPLPPYSESSSAPPITTAQECWGTLTCMKRTIGSYAQLQAALANGASQAGISQVAMQGAGLVSMLNVTDMLMSATQFADEYYVPRVCGFRSVPFPVFSGKELTKTSSLIRSSSPVGEACFGAASVLDEQRSYIVGFFSPVGQGWGLCASRFPSFADLRRRALIM